MKKILLSLFLSQFVSFCWGFGLPTPTPTNTKTITPTPTNTFTVTDTKTKTPTPTYTDTPTPSGTAFIAYYDDVTHQVLPTNPTPGTISTYNLNGLSIERHAGGSFIEDPGGIRLGVGTSNDYNVIQIFPATVEQTPGRNMVEFGSNNPTNFAGLIKAESGLNLEGSDLTQGNDIRGLHTISQSVDVQSAIGGTPTPIINLSSDNPGNPSEALIYSPLDVYVETDKTFTVETQATPGFSVDNNQNVQVAGQISASSVWVDTYNIGATPTPGFNGSVTLLNAESTPVVLTINGIVTDVQ